MGEPLGIFLAKLPGFTHSYIVNHIETILLNGTPIDDLESPLLENSKSTTLALSAAMPGLAGAILRRNSFHAALRSLSTPSLEKKETGNAFPVILKLFNTIATERGPDLLKHGIHIYKLHLKSFFEDRPSILASCKTISLDNNTLDQEMLDTILTGDDNIFIILKDINEKSE